jgi:hypothetical protein
VRARGFTTGTIDNVKVESGKSSTAATISLEVDPQYSCVNQERLAETFSQGGGGSIDILFVVDNSGSMAGEQKALASSFSHFVDLLETGDTDYHVAVITTGLESPACPPCSVDVPKSCTNETGETGRFQDRLGFNQGTEDLPDFVFRPPDPTCRVVDSNNLSCFYDSESEEGTALVGDLGCGYERGLAAMRLALHDLEATYNSGFLRHHARLAVVLVSDEEDCGEIGDVSEGVPPAMGNLCYFAAKGVGPEGETVHPSDPDQKTYRLTPVSAYADFLYSLKSSPAQVTFSAIVGVTDPNDPSTTTIEYEWNEEPHSRYEIVDACTTPGCTGSYCYAEPGTRYIQLAQMTGGVVESICQQDFSAPLVSVANTSTGFRRTFPVKYPPVSPDVVEVRVDGTLLLEGWDYYEPQQAVVFDEGKPPAPYSVVEISYYRPCP